MTARFHGKYRNARHPKVSVIIPVKNEVGTLRRVIHQAYQVHPRTEVVVVANGSTDGSKQLARRMGARVYSYGHSLGLDVGRSIGARKARGRILLFTDGDIVIPAYQLRKLVRAVTNGVDVALNRYSGRPAHRIPLVKHALNLLISRPDLKGASLTTIPHALSRRAIRRIGTRKLAVPPKAHAVAAASGLRMKAVEFIEVGRTNPKKSHHQNRQRIESLIIGDHLEALGAYIRRKGQRGRHTDMGRRRGYAR
ncbi:glycosyltransferase [Paenibacillus sp. CC-CFT747]|nr:glycosyltransferase [Paenibacillus sp. CC-CFT747]